MFLYFGRGGVCFDYIVADKVFADLARYLLKGKGET